MITLRPIDLADAPAIVAAVDQSRDALRRWMPWYTDRYDLRTAESWLESGISAVQAGHAGHFAILHSDRLVGVISIEDISEQTGRGMLGYWLATPATGRGIGRRAIAIVLDWARTRAEVRVVWAVVAEANVPSRRVLEANGLGLVGSEGIDERGDNVLLYELVTEASQPQTLHS